MTHDEKVALGKHRQQILQSGFVYEGRQMQVLSGSAEGVFCRCPPLGYQVFYFTWPEVEGCLNPSLSSVEGES